MESRLEQYIDDHTSPEPDHLSRLYRYTWTHRLYPRMCSGNAQGRLLKMLTSMIAPMRAIEIGTFTGYSTLCIAEGMPDNGIVDTIEIDDEYEDQLLNLFDSSPGGYKIRLHIGDALDIIPSLDTVYDMAFIDANKRNYIEYYELLLPRIKPGGFMLVDNTLWDDKVIQTPLPHDPQTRGIMEFNDLVAHDQRVETAIIPIRDGLTILRKL